MASETTPHFVAMQAVQIVACSVCGRDVTIAARDDDRQPSVTCTDCALGRGDS